MDAKKSGGDLRLLHLVLQQSRPCAWLALATLLVDLLAAPLVLLTPVPLKIVVDSVIGDQPVPGPVAGLIGDSRSALLIGSGGFLSVGAPLVQVQSLASSLLRTLIGERLTLQFRSRLFRHAQRLSFAYHDQVGTADTNYRIQRDAEALRSLVVEDALPLVAAAWTLFSVLYVTFRIDVELALVALAVSPVQFFLSRAYRRRLRDQSRASKRLESAALSVIPE